MKCLYSKCNNEVPRLSPRANNKKFCSVECRENHYYETGKDRERWTRANAKQSERTGRYGRGKIQCRECGRWYKFVMTHVRYKHGMNEAEYKAKHGIDRGRGLIADSMKEVKSQKTIENRTVENLKKGAHRRFRKGDHTLGRYERRAETLERLKKLHTLTKKHGNTIPTSSSDA